MSIYVKAKLDAVLARESHHLQEQKIVNVRVPMEVGLYVADCFSVSKQSQFPLCLNRTRHAATIRSDADWQRAIEQLESEIQWVTPAERKLFDKLFQHHERQLLQEVGTKATSP